MPDSFLPSSLPPVRPSILPAFLWLKSLVTAAARWLCIVSNNPPCPPVRFCSSANVSCRSLRPSGPSTSVHRMTRPGRMSLNITSASSPDPLRPVASGARWLSPAGPRLKLTSHMQGLTFLSPSLDLFTLMKSSLPLDCCYLSVFPFDELWGEAIQQRGGKSRPIVWLAEAVWPSRQEASCAPLKRLQIKADGRRQSDENVYYLKSDGGSCSQEAAKNTFHSSSDGCRNVRCQPINGVRK